VHSSSDTAPGFDDFIPAPQLEHVVASSCELYDPAVHIWHVALTVPRLFVRYPRRHLQSDGWLLPIRDLEFVWHATHTLAVVAATAGEYVLFPQSVHTCGPSAVLYVPGTHAVHVWPFAPVYPALHWQSVASSLPAGAFEFKGQLKQLDVTCASVVEYSFAAQSVHVPTPTVVLYFPATHASQISPSVAPEYPALQMQPVFSVVGLNENVLAGHGTQLLSAVAAGSTRYLPATQLMHGVFSSDCLYVPAGQALHPTPGTTLHAVASGIAYRLSSVDTVCISLSVRCMSQIRTCARSQSLSCPARQLMHRFLIRSLCMLSILACAVAPGHSFGSPSDLVLVPLPTPSTSTLDNVTPPFLLHITNQLELVPTFSSNVFCTAASISSPCASNLFFDA
jgi:hypothetical protein